MGGETRILEGMTRDTSSLSVHQLGEQPLVVGSDPSAGVNRDSFWGPGHVEWDQAEAATMLGQPQRSRCSCEAWSKMRSS